MRRKFKARMIEENISEEMVAKAAGVDQRTVRNWLSGATDIKIRTAITIRNTFFQNDDLDELFSDDYPA